MTKHVAREVGITELQTPCKLSERHGVFLILVQTRRLLLLPIQQTNHFPFPLPGSHRWVWLEACLPSGTDLLLSQLIMQVLAHAQFCHPHVVLFREVFLTKTHLGIALEYVSGGDLYQYVRSAPTVIFLLAMLCFARAHTPGLLAIYLFRLASIFTCSPTGGQSGYA